MRALRRLSAKEELAVLRGAPRLLPYLMGQGLALEDAAALAHNAALLAFALKKGPATPKKVLETLSLDEIAALCEEYRAGEGWA